MRSGTRRNGFVTEGVTLFAGTLLAAKRVEGIRALADPENVRSRCLFEWCGSPIVGVPRRPHLDSGAYKGLFVHFTLCEEAKPLAALLASIDRECS